MPIVNAEILETAVAGIFQACAVPDEEARIVAAHLVDAEACGVVSHGLIRVPQYVQALVDGQIVPDAKLRVRAQTTATAVLDGGHGFGQVMASRAMDWAIDRAELAGVCAVTLCNCSHTGRLGSFTERATSRGMAALMMVNTGGAGQWVAPFGGSVGRLSTNPISIAVPGDGDAALLLDVATSLVPEGKVRASLAAGQRVPEGWIIDHEGRPATDPAALYGPPRGAILPFGGHKGFGLAMLIDALAGGLSGAGCCTDANTPMGGKTDGVFLVAVKIEAFAPLIDFQQTIGHLIRHVKSAPAAPGVAEVLVPGELEAKTRRHRLREGIPIEPATWAVLQQIQPRSLRDQLLVAIVRTDPEPNQTRGAISR
jgi:hydroxycarboxylate dehydrogenase B